MNLSIIIPTLNEAANIVDLIRFLQQHSAGEEVEIIVVDGGSQDQTQELVRSTCAKLYTTSQRGRALQMNEGAKLAKGEILYFVHGDTFPVASYIQDIREALEEGFPVGCYRYKFDSPHPLLKINAYFTRFNFMWCRGGDQSLFIRKEVFEALKGFKQEQVIMEDFEFLQRLKGRYPFRVIPKSMTVSARKYEDNGYLRVQVANFVAFNMFRFGSAPQKIEKVYKRLLNHR